MAESWYIVQCNPNCERKADREMRRRGFGTGRKWSWLEGSFK